ncbi:MAG TPA: YdeI/OmpD-associated family protein [Gemmatimonadales bacterium]|nr:YdeI/OmpD-associated family protein [Gemmatimonadales bacterium]
MGSRDARVDRYLAEAPEFARPILVHLRELIHDTCPEVEETVKWRVPTFMYHGTLCGMAAFKRHAAIGFWKSTLMVGKNKAATEAALERLGRMTALADLPPRRTLVGYIREAMRLNAEGIKPPRRTSARAKPPLAVPPEFQQALARHRKARAAFEAFSPSHRREYIEWITGAKRDETRARRVRTAIEWLSQGKPRNWKYL